MSCASFGSGLQCPPRPRRRKSRLTWNAVVHRSAILPPRLSVPTLPRAVSFCLFERTSFASFIHGRLTSTQSRSIVRSCDIRASCYKSRASQDYPFHGRASRGKGLHTAYLIHSYAKSFDNKLFQLRQTSVRWHTEGCLPEVNSRGTTELTPLLPKDGSFRLSSPFKTTEPLA